jgi:hypothetical protein
VFKLRRMRWSGHVAHTGEGRGVYRVLVGRPEGKISLGRPMHMWKDNIKMDLREKGINGANWILLAQDRPWWQTCEHGNEPSGSIKKAGYCLTKWETTSFSKNILHHAVSE